MSEHGTVPEFGWPDDAVELLKRRWSDGASGAEIAREITKTTGHDVTRNAVVAKVHRLKLAKRVTLAAAPKPRPPKRHGNAGQPQAAAIMHRIAVRHEFAPTPLLVEDGVDVTRLIGLRQLTDHRCRWPHGDPLELKFGFCGAPSQAGSPYCPVHHRRAYIQI